MHCPVGRHGLQWSGGDRVGIAASVQQEILVLHVGHVFRVKRHAHEVKVGIEAVDLDGVLDVVPGGPVAVVVGVSAGSPCMHGGLPTRTGWHGRQRVAAQDVGGGV